MIIIILSNNIRRLLSGFIVLSIVMLILNGCSIITIDTMKNDPLMPLSSQSPPPKTRASEKFADNRPNKDIFIGIAMSGGGSRATNFSAAVLRDLDKLGILQHATVISSVSGSSVAAAYYGLYGDNRTQDHPWDDEGVRKAFLTDFEQPWLISWFCPRNIFRYWLTNFSRSDIMANVLDDKLFDEHKYANFGNDKLPRIFINATSYTNGNAFVFSDEYFAERLNSRLDTYPVAKAVMASSAFPGVFHDITLKDYSVKNVELKETQQHKSVENYEHLIDGGPSDNLGVIPIKRVLEQMPQPKNCFLFVVDAYPYQEMPNDVQTADTREWYDFIVDTNVATSSDIMLTARRKDLMKDLTQFGDDVGFESYRDAEAIEPERTAAKTEIKMLQEKLPIKCSVWHITFQRLHSRAFERGYGDSFLSAERLQFLRRMRKVVNSVATRYKLTETLGYSPEAVQDYLFKAADILVREDKNESGRRILDLACDKFKRWGLPGLKCDLNNLNR